MKQIYYVIQTLLRGRGSNIIKVISFRFTERTSGNQEV